MFGIQCKTITSPAQFCNSFTEDLLNINTKLSILCSYDQGQ